MMPVSVTVNNAAAAMTNRARNFNLLGVGLLDSDDDDDEDEDNSANYSNILSEYSLPPTRRVPGRLFHDHQQQQSRYLSFHF